MACGAPDLCMRFGFRLNIASFACTSNLKPALLTIQYGREILINFCNPVITIGQATIMDRAPEFFDHDAAVLAL